MLSTKSEAMKQWIRANGRQWFAQKQGSQLRPGVRGTPKTPDELRRKGSFLRRMFTHPRGPMKDGKGNPTRLALSAHAWGEPVPKTLQDAQRLAEKGAKLLEQYHRTKEPTAKAAKPANKKVARKSPAKAKRKR